MKKLLFIIASGLFFVSCTKNISQFNDETKRPANVPAPTLFSNATRNLSDALASASVNTNVFRFTVKHWAMAVYQDEAQYDFATRNIPQTWWTIMYKDVLADLNESARLITEDNTLDPVVKANKLAIIDLMQVYTFDILVNTFGDIPYSGALDANNLFPAYDDAQTIYADLLKRVADDITNLNTAGAAFTSSEDLLYKGNVSSWKKFANSLRMKMGMLLADSDGNTAKSNVEASDAAALSSSADDAKVIYQGSTPNTNPLYADIVLGGRPDYVASEDLMNILISMSDPRKANYFGVNNDGLYQGGIVGKVNTFSDMSKPSDKVSAATAPEIFMDYVETEFYRAEAKERGYNVSGTAEEHYNNAIKASIIGWGGTLADANAYLSRTDVAYATAHGDWKEKIGFQKWLAMYNRPYDGWTELRRLDYPKLTPPVAAISGFPTRLTYPSNEQQLNGKNYTSAAAKIGGDEVETKLFWDKY
jgi:hypothetical protein